MMAGLLRACRLERTALDHILNGPLAKCRRYRDRSQRAVTVAKRCQESLNQLRALQPTQPEPLRVGSLYRGCCFRDGLKRLAEAGKPCKLDIVARQEPELPGAR